MEIIEVTAQEYSEVIVTPYHIFGSAIFNNLNSSKCDEVFYLLFKEVKFRLGFICGRKEIVLYSPFSAPFGGFSFISSDVRIQYIEDAVKSLKQWARLKGFRSINITLPPSFYNGSFIAKQINCLWREEFGISEIELNHSFELSFFNEKYSDLIWYNARKNLRISLNAGLQFISCSNDDEKIAAYEIIAQNRKNRGKPLRMKWQQVSETISIINADFFVVKNIEDHAIASAIVFHISNTVVQVIYWGDLPNYSELKPMNFIAYKIFEHYKLDGKMIVDIGYSTENSIPNYGLSEFKESIGCTVSPKYNFSINLR
jgi:hypothetical protein